MLERPSDIFFLEAFFGIKRGMKEWYVKTLEGITGKKIGNFVEEIFSTLGGGSMPQLVILPLFVIGIITIPFQLQLGNSLDSDNV